MKTELLIIGGDGDLAIRKIYPALVSLECGGQLDDVSNVTAISRNPKDRDEILKQVHAKLESSDLELDAHWSSFSSKFRALKVDATDAESVRSVAETIDMETTQVIVYLAIPPKIFEATAKALNEAGLVNSQTRVVVEKPLGTDKQSFLQINQSLAEIFDESQVYRIDHYLGKESVQNLLALRFANIIFGSIWNGNFVDNVQITISETVGVEDRHEFFEETGSLRDMVQNHMLQILCLIAMEPPANRKANMIRIEKSKVLQTLKPIELAEINNKTVRGQYTAGSVNNELVPGYREEIESGESGSTSEAETYVAIKAEVDNWRWSNVPFYLRTGKRMPTRCAEVLIQFRVPKHNLFPDQMVGLAGNQLRIRLQPDEGIELHFLNKTPGLGELPMKPLSLDLNIPDSHKQSSYDAYARLLLEVLRGDQTLFISSDEVIASWEWIDQIRENWAVAGSKVHPYSAGSFGPSQSVVMMARDNREWIDLSR